MSNPRGTLPPAVTEDYRDLELCRLFYCTPSQLDREDANRVMRLWHIDRAIERWREMEADSAAKRANAKGRR